LHQDTGVFQIASGHRCVSDCPANSAHLNALLTRRAGACYTPAMSAICCAQYQDSWAIFTQRDSWQQQQQHRPAWRL
jgi:hypothetical protein